MRERRERRRAEAAKRGRGEDDDSKMKTAAALFIAREGMKNFFGKFSGTTFRDQEQDEEERAAEEALRELAAARATEDASSLDGNGTTARAAEDAASLDGSETPASAAVDDDNKPGIPKTNRDADKRSKASERPVAKTKAKASDETGKKKRPAAATKKEEAPRAKRVKDVEQSTVPKRSKKRESQETRTDSSGAETGTAAMKMKAARPAVDSSENTGDAARPEPQLLDYFTGGARLSKSAIAWMAGGAAGSVAVVVIATVIVNSHVIGL
jgi:hypothetical protein